MVLLLLVVLVSPELMSTYAEINPHDEAKYIESGRLLLKGEVRNMTWGPAVAAIYAPLHLIVGGRPDWFITEAWLGRAILFLSLCVGTCYLAARFKPLDWRGVLGLLFVSTVYINILSNPSDALFVTLSAVSLAELLAYMQRGQVASLAVASACLGLGVLSRFEGIVLLLPMLLIAFLARGSKPLHRVFLPSLIPAGLVLGIYLLSFRVSSPGLDLGIGSKSYFAFEVNHPLPESGTHADRRELARALFGTPEENKGSVLRAIARNPAAFANRVAVNITRLPDLYLEAFGKRLGPATLLFASWGAYLLLRTGHGATLGAMALWGMAVLVSLAFRPVHLIYQTSPLVLVLSSLGVGRAASPSLSKGEGYSAISAMLLLAIFGLLDQKLALLVVGVVLAAALALPMLATVSNDPRPAARHTAGALLLAAGLILRGSYPFPDYPTLGSSPEEQVVYFLQGELAAGSRIMGTQPLPALAARLEDVSWGEVPGEVDSAADLHGWLISRNIAAVFVDERDMPRPELVELLERGGDAYFELGYQSENGRLRVIRVLGQAGQVLE